MKLKTVLFWFDKKTELLVGAEEIKDITSADKLCKVLDREREKEDPELIDGDIELDEFSLFRLSSFLNHQYDSNNYDYFIGRRN